MSGQLALFDTAAVEDALPDRVLAMYATHLRKFDVDCMTCVRFMLDKTRRWYTCEVYGDDGTRHMEWHGWWGACGRWEVKEQ